MKSNDNQILGAHVTLPFPPMDRRANYEMEIYVRFMRRIRSESAGRVEVCIPTAIACVADMMNTDEAEIFRVLEMLGLRTELDPHMPSDVMADVMTDAMAGVAKRA